MFSYRLGFESPWYLLLLLLIPLVWWIGRRSLAALGPVRRWTALLLRWAVIALVVLALAQVQMVRTSERLTVIYLLDQSLSIPPEGRQAMLRYTNEAIRRHREENDRAGVIVFGRDAAIEIPPFEANVEMTPLVDSTLDPEGTNLASAMRLAQASFPEDAARRIVIVSDGNENLGNALEQGQRLADAGVGIDVVPIRYQHSGEIIVDRVVLPSDVRQGQPFDVRVAVSNIRRQADAKDSGNVTGRLIIKRRMGTQTEATEQRVTLPPGKRVFTFRQTLERVGFFTYEASFEADRAEDDTMRQNNRATAFTHIQGKGQVLLIEDREAAGEYEALEHALREHKIEVVRQTGDSLFTSLPELQQFDAVILANVPREQFSEAQVQMLVRNTEQMGAGLVMLGGPNSFGAGGWTNTEVEKAMPVDFTIKASKVIPRGALAMVMHASEMAQGNYWQKVIGKEALKALGPMDYCGVIHYGNIGTEWLWRGMLTVGENRQMMLKRLDLMFPGDMPDFDPGLNMAHKALTNLPDAAVKHLIIISDGDPSGPSGSTLAALAKSKITVSSVGVGTHGAPERGKMQNIAMTTGGKYYEVTNPNALPRIFQREARRVAQPLVYENKMGFQPQVRFPHEMLSGIASPLAPITGFVRTTRKENPLVEVSLVSPEPSSEQSRTLLASWVYGMGRAVAMTTDGTSRWAKQWMGWNNYSKLMGQIVRWAMRPVRDDDKFFVNTEVKDGRVQVVITALDKNDDYLNYMPIAAQAVGPDLASIPVKIEQTAPGRYVGSFVADGSGSYMINVLPGPGRAPVSTGITVPYSDEFRALGTNQAMLDQLAHLEPKGGDPGKSTEPLQDASRIEPLLEMNSFRHDLAKATSSQAIWHYLLVAACWLFFCDVFTRRVQVSFTWVGPLVQRLLRRQTGPAAPETIDRLRSRKAQISDRLEQLRTSTRFEPSVDAPTEPAVVKEIQQSAAPASPSQAPPSMTPAKSAEDEDYTSRLLRAKQKAREKRKE